MGNRSSTQVYKKSHKKGKETEEACDKDVAADGRLEYVRGASFLENTRDHWDRIYKYNGKEFKFDIKGMKSINYGEKSQTDFTWIELHGVDSGDVNSINEGWLYGAKSDYIVFEMDEHWSIVNRTKLISKVESLGFNQNSESTPTNNDKQPYVVYHRYGRDGKPRNDKMLLISTTHIEDIRIGIIRKSRKKKS